MRVGRGTPLDVSVPVARRIPLDASAPDAGPVRRHAAPHAAPAALTTRAGCASAAAGGAGAVVDATGVCHALAPAPVTGSRRTSPQVTCLSVNVVPAAAGSPLAAVPLVRFEECTTEPDARAVRCARARAGVACAADVGERRSHSCSGAPTGPRRESSCCRGDGPCTARSAACVHTASRRWRRTSRAATGTWHASCRCAAAAARGVT